jgi:hypothetical protein
MRLALGLAIVTVVLLGGCRESDEAVKAKLRADMVQGCTAQLSAEAASRPGFDGPKYCACIAAKFIGNRSVGELRNLLGDKAAGKQIGDECAAQQIAGDVPAQAPTAPADPQAAAPAAPAEPPAEEGEAAGEAEEYGSEDTADDSQ